MRCQSLAKWVSVLSVMIVVAVSAVTVHGQAKTAPKTSDKTATQVYMDYVAAMPKAKSIDDIKMYMSAGQLKQINATPAAQRAQMFGMVQAMAAMNTGIKVTKETKTAAGATLTATAKDSDGKPQKGTVKMVLEGGSWKLDQEQWGN